MGQDVVPEKRKSQNRTTAAVQLSLPGLIVFTISLMVASSLLTGSLVKRNSAADGRSDRLTNLDGTITPLSPERTPPWGQLVVSDILLERPEEYVAFELNNRQERIWNFGSLTPVQARQLMIQCGLPTALVEHALAAERATAVVGRLLVVPDEKLILELTADQREKLYGSLGRQPENHYMHSPFLFPNEDFDRVIEDERLEEQTKSLIRKLSYRRGSLTCFSDLGFVLDHVSTEPERLQVVKALSRISALMVRLRVGPETDIDKMVNYWASVPGVRSMDVRPLLESVQRIENGGTVSLLHVLPPFARERLFTFPLHSSFGEAGMDCHWSTMNFFLEEPDDRFADETYTSGFVATNCYSIAKPSQYGDLVFLLDANGRAIHSAVYIADDIVFTKNGSGYTQPWLLMRLKEVAATYARGGEPRLAFFRNKSG